MAVMAPWLVLLLAVSAAAVAAGKHEWWRTGGAVGAQVVEKERRRVVATSDAGTVTAVNVADAEGAAYRLHFITMDPGALFLPVQLHADMVFYVHSGSGKITHIEEGSGEQSSLEVQRGDVYNFEQGTVFHIRSYPNATRQHLRIYAIFSSEAINSDDPRNPKVEAFSSVSNLVKGFEEEVLRLGFGVPREVAEAIKSAETPPAIIPYNQEQGDDDRRSNWSEGIVDALLGVRDPEDLLNKKKDKHKHKKDKKSKSKAFNFYSGKPDVENCYGWSRTMTNKDLDALEGSDIGTIIVNLTTGSMIWPHWNPKATEIAIVTEGEGIVQTVCSSSSSPSGESKKSRRRGHSSRHEERRREWDEPGGRGEEKGQAAGARSCRNSVFHVKEGDVFVVPRFHAMAPMSFNNDSFVFVGFSTRMGQNHPQFLAGKSSVLRAIGKEVLALALGQRNASAVEQLLAGQHDSTILSCVSCAEELEEKAEEERRRKGEEEEGGGSEGPGEHEEEERRERERKEREQEERQRKEKEERRRQEEEERAKEDEERKREREEEERRERERKEREEEERREQEELQRREEEERRRQEEERAREEEERRKEEERGDEPGPEEEEEARGWRRAAAVSFVQETEEGKKRYRVGKRGFFGSG